MKLSPETKAILDNFSKINRGILIDPGSILKSYSLTAYAEAVVGEDFPMQVGISDTRDFLRMVALFRDPIFDFTPENILISEEDGTAQTKYPCAGAGVFQPNRKRKSVEPPAERITFTLTEMQLSTLQSALGIAAGQKKKYKLPFLRITSDGKLIRLSTQKNRQSTPDGYTLTVAGHTDGHECQMLFDTDNLPMMAGSYSVTVTANYTTFQNTSGYNLFYLVGSEPIFSTWGQRKTYQVAVTKSHTQRSHILVQAHSPEEAESIAGQEPDEVLEWTEGRWPTRECRVVVG